MFLILVLLDRKTVRCAAQMQRSDSPASQRGKRTEMMAILPHDRIGVEEGPQRKPEL